MEFLILLIGMFRFRFQNKQKIKKKKLFDFWLEFQFRLIGKRLSIHLTIFFKLYGCIFWSYENSVTDCYRRHNWVRKSAKLWSIYCWSICAIWTEQLNRGLDRFIIEFKKENYLLSDDATNTNTLLSLNVLF